MWKAQEGMHGTREAAQHWQRKSTETMWEFGFAIGQVSPCHFFHNIWQACGLVHGNNNSFVGEGRESQGHIEAHCRVIQGEGCLDRRR